MEMCGINKYTEDAPHRDAKKIDIIALQLPTLVKLTQCLFDLILILRAALIEL